MLQKIKELIFPSRCVCCDEIMNVWEKGVCQRCLPKLKYISNPFCVKCGKQLVEEDQEICRDCNLKTHNFISGRALYEYEEIAASIYRYKYQGRREYATFFAEEIAFYLGEIGRAHV